MRVDNYTQLVQHMIDIVLDNSTLNSWLAKAVTAQMRAAQDDEATKHDAPEDVFNMVLRARDLLAEAYDRESEPWHVSHARLLFCELPHRTDCRIFGRLTITQTVLLRAGRAYGRELAAMDQHTQSIGVFLPAPSFIAVVGCITFKDSIFVADS